MGKQRGKVVSGLTEHEQWVASGLAWPRSAQRVPVLGESIWSHLSGCKHQPLERDQGREVHVSVVQHPEQAWMCKWVCGH